MPDSADWRQVDLATRLLERGHTPRGIHRAFMDAAGGANGDLAIEAERAIAEAVKRVTPISAHCPCVHCIAAAGAAATAEAERIVHGEAPDGPASEGAKA